MSEFARGVPSLVDVTFTDREASKDFYRELLGWRFDDALDPSGTYTYAVRDGDVVAGLRPAPPDQPPAWTLYLGVADVAAAAERVGELGGQVFFRNDVPGQGSVLIGSDPGGAVFGLWRPESGAGLRRGEPGTLTWAELRTPEGERSDAFYQGLLGHTAQQIGDGAAYDYAVYSVAERPVLGRHRVGEQDLGGAPPHWMVYFAVDPAVGTDALVERAAKLGGGVLAEPADIPAGRFAVVTDPAGAAFALVDESRATRR
ncbi:VOC family protein [Marinitenerispora sediminis]|uniref:VOC domain-containing protein n=1 Tax=Marinitenerispora sediminis TaxID=1931232 RepID=A0A368TAR5_9ACTN|nr:VOC family protein [Marinitenerispora sediminis]RCV53975.1 hypothetical protein DEF28_09325 [Marinitenerispora sediminis]RCV60474.1 hypothetical protein DEF23_04505 [Marinitenerispora sediminis]RCV61845.1 hypothetical protein DEF24_03185 [Marinitenerispora sediminis]